MRILTLLALAGCSGSPCVDVSAQCSPLYEPTFDNLYERTFQPSCALEGGCHAADSASAGLDLSEIEAAYDALSARVDADELGCHTLITRVDAEAPEDAMPPGAPLNAAERCAIRQWVDAGAPR